MAKLTEDMKKFLNEQLAYIATVSKEGDPNIGPKRTMRIYDDETLEYNENTGGQTYRNLLDNAKAAIAVVNREELKGYRFVGTAEIFTEGEIFEDAANWDKYGKKTPKAAVLIHINKIYNLQIGPNAGTLLVED